MNDGQDSIPPLAMLMGCGGLVPFFLCAGAAHSGVALWSGIALVICGIYGAIILSFIGAVHWGLALKGDRSPLWFVWSVVPALYAWQPVVFLDTRMALLALVPGFLVSWSVDRRATAAGLLPAWYMRLRHMLTLGATLALAAGSLAPSPYFHG
ncbi:MAG: DUF3429 domain-containing protein [Pseudomonadota bacterium]|nr:DUF3429 domain-containing protein [Pseudomonadota bacterium]